MRLKTASEIRKIRRGKGFFRQEDMVQEFASRGHEITRSAYSMKETGKSSFSALELKLLSDILGLSLDETYDIFL